MGGKGESGESQPAKAQSKIKPPMSGLSLQTSCEGLVIPVVYGQARVGGNIIWMGALVSTLQEEGGDEPPVEPWPPDLCFNGELGYIPCLPPPPIDALCWDVNSQSWILCSDVPVM